MLSHVVPIYADVLANFSKSINFALSFACSICSFAFLADTHRSNVPSPLSGFRAIADREAESVRTVSMD